MTTNPIVVGVDGSPAALRAVDLAAQEARLRNLPLRVVYANTWASHPGWVDLPAPAADPRGVVDEALARITAVPATADILVGTPPAVLMHESRRAALLVVGHGRRVDLHLPGLGSVARQLAAHA